MDDARYYPANPIPSLILSVEQRKQISLLSFDDLARIHNWLMSFAIRAGRKVFFVAMSAREEVKAEFPSTPPEFYILRVQKLIEEKRLVVSLGEIENWRACEVILPPGEIEWK
jgi:hypothetical protein